MDSSFVELADAVAARIVRALADGSVRIPVATPWFSADEAADYLRTTVKALQHHRADGTGPRFSKVGRVVRYRCTDLDAWLQSGERGSNDK